MNVHEPVLFDDVVRVMVHRVHGPAVSAEVMAMVPVATVPGELGGQRDRVGHGLAVVTGVAGEVVNPVTRAFSGPMVSGWWWPTTT